MKTYANQSVEARPAHEACWNLRRTGGQHNMVSYELCTRDVHDNQAADVTLHVIGGLLGGLQVGVMAESGEAGMPALTKMANAWRDGRLLKRSRGGAFVAMEHDFAAVNRDDMEPCVGAGATFRFIGLEPTAPEDCVFRSLLENGDGAVIELCCPDLAGGVLRIRWNAEKIDESAALGGISAALGDCGQSLRVEM